MTTRDFRDFPVNIDWKEPIIQTLMARLFDRQNIDLQQELTTVAAGDELYIFDVSATGIVKTFKVTVSNLLAYQINALFDISGASGGQIKFPATQNASADANTLDDYEEGTFTPTVTFGTPGNLSVTYANQEGRYTKIGRMVMCEMYLQTSAFTHTTAAGNFIIAGLPFASSSLTLRPLAKMIRHRRLTVI